MVCRTSRASPTPTWASAPAMEQMLGPRRPPHRPWNLDDAADQRYADIAATLQQVTEKAVQPIIGNGIDALGFLMSHPIDALVVGDLVITRGAA